MFKNELPLFGKGSILKKEMLENLRDFPREFIDVYYRDASDGIISGCDIHIEEASILINEGIIKHNGRIYFFKGEERVENESINKEVILKLKFMEEDNKSNFIRYGSEIFLDDRIEIGEDELELGRFKLKEGAKLRANYIDFADLSTEYNTFNIINVKYSGTAKDSVHPLILKHFSENIMKSGTKEVEDLVFAMLCMNSRVIERNLILEYICRNLGIEKKAYTNVEIYKNLLKIIKNTKDGRKQPEVINRNRPRMIIVD